MHLTTNDKRLRLPETLKNNISILGYVLMLAGLLGLVGTYNLFSPSLPVIVMQAGAVALMVWARVTFGRRSFHLAASATEGGLVTTGPYAYIRHPIYTSVCLFIAAAVAAHWSLLALAMGCLVFTGAFMRIFSEEAALSARYPEYRDYAAKTARMIPFVF